jgi:hypothetical protein
MRPGKKIRIRGYDSLAGAWKDFYVGKIATGASTYVSKTRVVVSASDAIAELANQAESRTVATIPELAYLLEGKSVPWLVNGEGSQITTAAIVGKNENASILDQVAITRDTDLGRAFVNRKGILEVSDQAAPTLAYTLSDDPADLTATCRSYTAIDVAFSTEECINSVTVKWLRWKASKNETTEIIYGPYRDEASIAAWGVRAAEFTVAGAASAETTAGIAAYAQSILTANATPVVGPRSLTFNAKGASEMALALDAELGSKITVKHKGVTYTPRIEGITHSITPNKWLVTLDFAEASSVAAPTVVPSPLPPGSGSNAPQAGYVNVAMGAAGTVVTTAITFPQQFATIPALTLTAEIAQPDNVHVGFSSLTTTGFSLKTLRSNSNADVPVHWIALPRD